MTNDFWKRFQKEKPEYATVDKPQSYHFCDNEKDANECAELVVKGIKQATSSSVWWYDQNNQSFPKSGDLAIVTNWAGEPKAITKVKKVEIVSYRDITPEYAFIEGEGDRSLDYWKKVHWDYYSNEMKDFDDDPTEDMEIVCEYFETIWVG